MARNLLINVVIYTVVLIGMIFLPSEFFLGFDKASSMSLIAIVWAILIAVKFGGHELSTLGQDESDETPAEDAKHHPGH